MYQYLTEVWVCVLLTNNPVLGLTLWLGGKESTCQCRRCGFTPWVGKIPWDGHGTWLQCYCLGHPLDGGAWWATVQGGAKVLDVTELLNDNNPIFINLLFIFTFSSHVYVTIYISSCKKCVQVFCHFSVGLGFFSHWLMWMFALSKDNSSLRQMFCKCFVTLLSWLFTLLMCFLINRTS